MAIKKSELQSFLEQLCAELRGGMDISPYKDYVLILLFVKYISDKYAGVPQAPIDVPHGGSFADMVAAKNVKNMGDKLNKIIAKLASANKALQGAIDVIDFNDEDKLGKSKEMVDRLSKLISVYEHLDFDCHSLDNDYAPDDAYEYLMSRFTSDPLKSKGQFYTPLEISRTMVSVIDLHRATSDQQSIYDPACGFGSTLLFARDEAFRRCGLNLLVYGQELDEFTFALARINMVLHHCRDAQLWQGNTLSGPHFKSAENQLQTFDFIVANPPFPAKSWTSGFNPANDVYGRFKPNIPTEKSGDYAFLLHILHSLKSTGKAAVVLPHDVLFRSGVEGAIRTQLLKQGFIKGIIGLPANLYQGTSVPACIMVLDKENAADRDHIVMIKASQGFVQEGHKNRLRARDVHQMTDAFNRQLQIPHYSRNVSLTEIEKLGYNLNLARYFDDTTPSLLQYPDIPMTGGKIPTAYIDRLEVYWRAFPNMRYSLFADTSSTVGGDCQLIVEPGQIQTTVLTHPDFAVFTDKVTQLFSSWTATVTPLLTSIAQGQRSIGLIDTLSESLLDTFRTHSDVADLLDPYLFYQHLMDYWENTMQRDVCMIIHEGWQAMRGGTPNIELVEPALIVERYFNQDQADHQDSTQKPLTTYADLTEQDTVVMKKIKNGTSTIHLKVIGKYSELTQDEVTTLVVNHKWLDTLERCVHHELHHCGLTLSAQIQQIAGCPMASIRLD